MLHACKEINVAHKYTCNTQSVVICGYQLTYASRFLSTPNSVISTRPVFQPNQLVTRITCVVNSVCRFVATEAGRAILWTIMAWALNCYDYMERKLVTCYEW